MTHVWKNIGPLDNIPAQGARRLCFGHEGQPIAIFRTGDDQLFALVDECPHRRGPPRRRSAAPTSIGVHLSGLPAFLNFA